MQPVIVTTLNTLHWKAVPALIAGRTAKGVKDTSAAIAVKILHAVPVNAIGSF